MTELIYAHKNPEVIKTLLARRSASAKAMAAPGPGRAELETILAAAMRTPDHGKLNPWWFITFEGQQQRAFAALIASAWAKREPLSTPEKLADEERRFLRAPLVIAVVSSPRESAIPVWEQVLSAGAACQNLCLAANALGYGANWLTEWYSYDETIRETLKLAPQERIAGFIYIGTPTATPEERARPQPQTLVNSDYKNSPNRGHEYAKTGLGYIVKGMPET